MLSGGEVRWRRSAGIVGGGGGGRWGGSSEGQMN